MSDFNGSTSDDLRKGILDQLRSGTEPGIPADTQESAAQEDKAQTTADRLRVNHIMRLPSDKTSTDDQAFLRAQINAALKAL